MSSEQPIKQSRPPFLLIAFLFVGVFPGCLLCKMLQLFAYDKGLIITLVSFTVPVVLVCWVLADEEQFAALGSFRTFVKVAIVVSLVLLSFALVWLIQTTMEFYQPDKIQLQSVKLGWETFEARQALLGWAAGYFSGMISIMVAYLRRGNAHNFHKREQL